MSRVTLRNLIVTLIIASLAIASLGYMIYKVASEGSRLEQQISDLEEQNTQEASLIQLQRVAYDTEEARNKLQDYFLLKESDSIDFLNDIEELAPTVGLSLKTENLEQITGEDDSSWIQVNFFITGSRQDIQNFVQILEIIPYVSKLTNINLKSRSGSIWEANITMQVQVLAYDK